jgi:hypothetical protein
MCKQALALEKPLAALVRESSSMSPDQFRAAWERFLTEQQGNL